MKKVIFCVVLVVLVGLFPEFAVNAVARCFGWLGNHARGVTFVITATAGTYAILKTIYSNKK